MSKTLQTEKPKSGEKVAVLKTNRGTMKCRLFTSEVPTGTKNFIDLAEGGKYTNVPFHRIIKGFMIQGGDFTSRNGTGGHAAKGPGSTIGDEFHPSLKHIRGALSYAKTSRPNSIGSQFFIVHPEAGTHFLDHREGGAAHEGYTVFGQLYDGFEVLDAIANTKTDSMDAPLEPMTIETITIEEIQ